MTPSSSLLIPVEPSRLATPDSVGRGQIATLLLGMGAFLYTMFLYERQWPVIVGQAGFGVQRLNWWECVFYLLIFAAEVITLLLTCSALLFWVFDHIFRGRRAPDLMIPLTVIAAYVIAITIQCKIFSYLKDGLTMAAMRGLGAGSIRNSLAFVVDEMKSMAGVGVLIVAAVGVGGCLLLPRIALLRRPKLIVSRRVLWIASGLCILCPPVLLLVAPAPLTNAVGHTLVHQIYSVPALYLTDFDGDGYSFMSRPADFAPFDAKLHPYAVEIPGNGIDEDGIGGDLPAVIWHPTARPWVAEQLQPKNVLLIVLESARCDLLEASVSGMPAMPVLRSNGSPMQVFSHSGFSLPSVSAIMNGTMDLGEQGDSLITRFKSLGYKTGVFSAQAETAMGIAQATHMADADTFVTAESFPPEYRVRASSSVAWASVPAAAVNTKFEHWLKSAQDARPFFAYINWQEMHFPYHYEGSPTPLWSRPIARHNIMAGNKEQLRNTYLNAARVVDNALGDLLAMMDGLGLREDTLIVVVGDHGEELFDTGYLGHGLNVSFEQNATVAKVINSDWPVPSGPVGESDIMTVIHNSLLRKSENAIPISTPVLIFGGGARKPSQIGAATPGGILKYDFFRNEWSHQANRGAPFLRAAKDDRIIHMWESYVIAGLKAR